MRRSRVCVGSSRHGHARVRSALQSLQSLLCQAHASHITHLLCADQAGFDTSPPLYMFGGWSVESVTDFDAEYLECHREAQFLRLRGHEQQPSEEEFASLPWPHCNWWQDRDRIVLMTEYLDFAPPDGSFEWERCVCHHAMSLWSDGRAGSSHIERQPDAETCMVAHNRMGWSDFCHDEAPGWRMLSSLPSCPNPHMRFPMSRDLYRRVREGESACV